MAYTNIDDPSAYFHTQIWTGNSGYTVNVTNNANSGDFQPDLIWAKDRVNAYNHDLVDSSRGPTVALHPNTTNAEYTRTQANYDFTSFDSNGFTTGAPDFTNSFGGNNNANGKVAWQWKANGGTTVSNTDGDLRSVTVQANQDAGFSIVRFLGGTTPYTAGHGLGVAPDVIISKRLGATVGWYVYHKSVGAGKYLQLNSNAAAVTSATVAFTSAPTSTIFTGGTGIGGATDYYINYCFAEKQGYSKFGKYVGNGNADGTFVYTGFKPAWVMTKETGASGAWVMYDNKRSTTANPQDKYFSANTADAEATFTQYDFLSNGFKFRTSGSENSNGNTHIYMAFAENPFVTSTGIPTTAR